MQYFYITYSNKISRIQGHENGCYFYHDGFLYSLDLNKKMIQPVCSRANCLHDSESDPERRKACHAFVSDQDPDVVSLMLYQDQLFVCIDRLSGRQTYGTVDRLSYGHSSIIRIASDGSSRELFYENEDIQIDITMLHRGYIYFQCKTFVLSDDSISSKDSIQRLNVQKKEPKPETVYALSEDQHLEGYGSVFQAYGKYVYFDYAYFDQNGHHDSTFIYDTETGEVNETDTLNYGGAPPCFYNGKLYCHAYVRGKGNNEETDIYCLGLDGTNSETMMKNIPQGKVLLSDGKYLYLENGWMVLDGDEEVKRFWVYDQDMNLVDELAVPDTYLGTFTPPVGGTDYQYQIFDDSENGAWGIYVFDKSKIGTLHGAPYPQEKIV
ncbi:MAG: hypothetical protein IKR11_11665, partial [Solobacterium sp.]|nr:hypothetical protein [Solobacterium sp.]